MFGEVNALCDVVRETSFAMHRYFRSGHLEKVYENSLANRLRKLGLHVEQQYPLAVYDEDGTIVGDYFADLFIDHQLIVELKAARAVVNEHVAQLLGYLRTSKIETGLLINFGAEKLYIKKYLLTP
ncbi:GxxExxY protein [Aeoliella sp. SH292]|uniref:GxxExxY protein n=1 Tax=Aeoliella sp. SH292 TaxID=3454464 RepID=UPI003F9AA7D0